MFEDELDSYFENTKPLKLPEALEKLFAEHAVTVKISKDQTLLIHDELTTSVYLIGSGLIEVSLFALNAKETIFRECGRGELLGELAAIDSAPRSMNVVAVKNSVIHQMDRVKFRALIDNNVAFREWFMRFLVSRVRELSHRIQSMSTLSVSSRILMELLRYCRQTPIRDDMATLADLPVHRKIASRLGTHREAVSRELSQLAKLGIIEQRARTIKVKSVTQLQQLLHSQLWATK